MFTIGQKVVCVNDDITEAVRLTGIPYNKGDAWLVKDNIYTIVAIGLYHIHDPPHSQCVLIEEIKRPKWAPIWASRFRPLVSKKTDIAIFTKMLKQKEKANV